MKLNKETMDALTTLERTAPGNQPALKGWMRGVFSQSGRHSYQHSLFSLFSSDAGTPAA